MAQRWAHYPLRMRVIGAAYSESWGESPVTLQPAALYDEIFLVRTVHPSKYLGPPKIVPPPISTPSNLDFEDTTAMEPAHWALARMGVYAGSVASITNDGSSHGHSALIARSRSMRMPGYGALHQGGDAKAWRGRRVRVRAAVRVDTRDPLGSARLYAQTENAAGTIALDQTSPIRSKDWQTYDLEIDVPTKTDVLRYGLAVTGQTRAWLDDVSVEIGRPAPSRKP